LFGQAEKTGVEDIFDMTQTNHAKVLNKGQRAVE